MTMTRKLIQSPAREAREDVRDLTAWRPIRIDEAIVEAAWRVEDRFELSFRDSLIVAAAQAADCEGLLTEDLHHGLEIDGLQTTNSSGRRSARSRSCPRPLSQRSGTARMRTWIDPIPAMRSPTTTSISRTRWWAMVRSIWCSCIPGFPRRDLLGAAGVRAPDTGAHVVGTCDPVRQTRRRALGSALGETHDGSSARRPSGGSRSRPGRADAPGGEQRRWGNRGALRRDLPRSRARSGAVERRGPGGGGTGLSLGDARRQVGGSIDEEARLLGRPFEGPGDGPDDLRVGDRGAPRQTVFVEWLPRLQRYGVSPGDMIRFARVWFSTDARSALPAIQVPAIVVVREGWVERSWRSRGGMRTRSRCAAGLALRGRGRSLPRRYRGGLGGVPALRGGDRGRARGVRPCARDRVVHRHRFLVGTGGRARRPGVEGPRPATPPEGTGVARPLPRSGDGYRGRWVLRDVRRDRRAVRIALTRSPTP